MYDSFKPTVEYKQKIPEYSEKITNNIEAVYWDIVADLGRTNITETIKWVDRSISRLEGLK